MGVGNNVEQFLSSCLQGWVYESAGEGYSVHLAFVIFFTEMGTFVAVLLCAIVRV